MTANKRIFLNIVATYGRSLYALAVGLFCGRWTLMALGSTDYGLFGLVGGMVGFIAFLNQLLASAIGRFYAISVGIANRNGTQIDGIDECRKWFNTAISIHTFVPIVLIVVGYPIGKWAVECFLTIPPDRVDDCIWVWRFTCVACFFGMFNVPFQSMYIAKQEIAELTIYSFITTTLNAVFLYYMVTHPLPWLAKFSAWTCFLSVAPQLVITLRAICKYPECRIVREYLISIERYKQLSIFAAARFWAQFTGMISTQGQSILVNKFMGPCYNASMTIANTVAAHTFTLSSAIEGAFWPAITNKIGEGSSEDAKLLCFMAMRLSPVLILVFAIPLMLEIKEVLFLWLKNPPAFAEEICVAIFIREILERMTCAYVTAINGYGKGVMRYSWIVGWAGVSLIAFSWLFFALGFGMWSIVAGILVARILVVIVRLVLGKSLIGFTIKEWLMQVFFPIAFLMLSTIVTGLIPHFLMSESLLRVFITSLVCTMVFIPVMWHFILSSCERQYIIKRIFKRKGS